MKAKTSIITLSLSKVFLLMVVFCLLFSCNSKRESQEMNANPTEITAKKLLGNPDYQAICYGGYRKNTREIEPTIAEIKEDLKILAALNIKIVRTYNVHYKEVSNLLEAISQLKKEDSNFEMYVMLGVWIDCKNAWTELEPIHNEESERNAIEIAEAVRLTNAYPEIIKIISVGNEAMVNWATSYYVTPNIILKWVNHLQELKKQNKLAKDVWITSSDDFASWGGGDVSYHTKDLENLIKAVDYVSMHTYPYHNTHYNPDFWQSSSNENHFDELQKVATAMVRSQLFAKKQFENVKAYVHSISPNKPIHIGETGWASSSDGFYGIEGSKASDEYKQALYYQSMRAWTNKEKITCFYFEAFDEHWKDSNNPNGSENHFGIFTVDGKAKFTLWNSVDDKVFVNLKRDGKSIEKTFSGNKELVMKTVFAPPTKR
ncbi:glycosyl hydrolase family 17 protein [uncultured Flavobacterium sp.]|uniref:glycosyl hydrolase family 17 protein n=1 Tax=uncultured Flavobacterium sp. TaxID=165435 RepID=UPI0026338C31|nr:glycosyl hydrolase family 17 protein [uncultured Flavobacterium sp.]